MTSSFNTAIASIRRTEVAFNYQLVVTRAYQEGEIELMDEDELDENDGMRFASILLKSGVES
jgi:hypothetical protein